MEARISERRPTRVPPQANAAQSADADMVSGAQADDSVDLFAQLDLAGSLHAQAMSATDWEIASRNIRRGRELLDSTRRQMALKARPQPEDERIRAQCAQLLADIDRAAALLRMRLARPAAAD